MANGNTPDGNRAHDDTRDGNTDDAIDGNTDDAIRDILTTTCRIALVGASDKPWRASHGVMRFLLERGYDVTPVNPVLAGQAIHGRTVVASLAEAAPLEMVDVFRASAHVAPVVDRAVQLCARIVWLQLGVIDEVAAAKARLAGIAVVMDRCPVIEDRRIGPFHAPRAVSGLPVQANH